MKLISVFDCISLTVYTFTFLLGLPANLLVLFVYMRKAQKHGATPNVVYTINLCLSNLVLVAWMPVKSAYTIFEIWILPELLCPIYNFFVVASLYGSGLLLTAVAVGRYLSIAFPISYKIYRRARTSCMISALLWAVVLLHLSLALVVEKRGYFVSPSMPNTSKCFENFTHEQMVVLLPLRLEMAILLFAVPLLLTAFCTLRCLALVKRSCLSAGSKRRILAMELSALLVFVVCYTPYNVSHVVGFIQKSNVHWRREAIVSSCCNVFLEPVVMLILSPSRPKDLLCRLCVKRSSKQHQEGIVQGKDPLATMQKETMSVKPQLGSELGRN
ncbi:free fatty acid receptor 2 [Silurus meridionalis]|uniref:free fatty acid receptor 2 n=1 Tax=Silurus meridionalis TaxID=175797 RepID=UPI001EE9C7B8|nr:free fatty acid receptor 2 [Silurus meridionalis]